ncbi:hypothetical protein [Thiomicrorhabdus hydrogeniphila]
MRWVLFIPLGIYEAVLLLLTFLMALLPNKTIATILYNHAQKLPGLDWYKR